MTPSPDLFEKLATFYLGRAYDLAEGKLLDELTLYDAKDLCTHAMCVGMTGSGKTGLCLSLLEEAAIDGVPAICIDPKGDLTNLMLAFPDLAPEDFQPWIQPSDASRRGKTVAQQAADTAAMWRKGLADWGQSPDRIRRFKDAVDVNVFTPGSNIGLPITVLKSFQAPSADVIADSDAMGSLVTGAASGLLTLLGLEADPLLSREHILISSILDNRWRAGRDVSIGDLIGLIGSPPIDRVGVLDLDTFMPPDDRGKLAMRLNNLLASPAFASWLEGTPLSIDQLLYTETGKPRLSILSIAHLSDRERMFFVTILLNELLAWMRTQSGTSSLRALFYMDEIAGYFPPVANPPSKPPMLTLLKQARAFGLGITLATQNPVDLDYKGLSNIGTWFLGRLQTERDKARVMEGLEGAAIQTGASFDRGKIDRILSSLGNRVFLMNNVHDDAPTVFHTRWAMSYLAGPLAREQISELMAPKRDALAAATDGSSAISIDTEVRDDSPPAVPPGIEQKFLLGTTHVSSSRRDGGAVTFVYRPALYGEASLHFIRANMDVDRWCDIHRWIDCGNGVPDDPWQQSQELLNTQMRDKPLPGFTFADLPVALCNKSNIRSYGKQLKDYVYRFHGLTIFKSDLIGDYAPPPNGAIAMQDRDIEVAARRYFQQLAREARDRETAALRSQYAKKSESLDRKIRDAQARVDREASQYQQAKVSSMISIGTSILGAFLGRKRSSRTSVNKVGTAARAGTRAIQQKDDVDRAEEKLTDLAAEQRDLNNALADDLRELTDRYLPDQLELEAVVIPPRKSDLKVSPVVLLWTPWVVDSSGIATPLYQ